MKLNRQTVMYVNTHTHKKDAEKNMGFAQDFFFSWESKNLLNLKLQDETINNLFKKTLQDGNVGVENAN